MGADPGDRAAVEDDDLVGAHDRADPLGHDDDRRVGDLIGERRPQGRVGLEVEGREAVVEDVDVGALDEGAGDREALPLPAREVGPALRDRRLQPVGQVADERLGLGDPERVPELLVGRVGLAEAEVAGDGPGEQERLLGDETDPGPEVLPPDRADVAAIDATGGHR